MRQSHLLAVIAGTFALVSCSSDSTGPTAQVAGAWVAEINQLGGTAGAISVSCQSQSSSTLVITQTGTTLSGTYDGGSALCAAQGDTLEFDYGSGVLAQGSVRGSSVRFDLESSVGGDTPVLHFTGTVTGDNAHGAVSVTGSFNGIAGTLNGTWSGQRQSGAVAARTNTGS